MKKKHYIIFSLIIIFLSALSGWGGFFYGSLITKQKAELDKEAAVKGAIFDAKEKLNEEAIAKAKEEVVSTTEDKNSAEAKKILEDFYTKITAGEYEEAYAMLSKDYKKTIYSVNGLKKDYTNFNEIKIGAIEYRSSGESSALFSIEIEKIPTTGTSKKDTYFVQLYKETTAGWEINSIELKEKKQNFNSAWGSNS